MKFRKLMAVALVAAMAATMAVGYGGSSSRAQMAVRITAAQMAEVILIHQMISQSYPVKMDPVQEELSLSCSE